MVVFEFTKGSSTPKLVTVSIGVTTAVPGEAPATVLARADSGLLRAKSQERACSQSVPAPDIST